MQNFVLLLYNKLSAYQLLIVFFFLHLKNLYNNEEFDL